MKKETGYEEERHTQLRKMRKMKHIMRKRHAGERQRERERTKHHARNRKERRRGEEEGGEEVRQDAEVRAKEKAIETLKEPRGC